MDDGYIISGTRVEYVSVLATMGLYGITCMQTFLYFVRYQQIDHWSLQSFVAFLWFMDTAHIAFICRGFWVLISRAHDPFILSLEYMWGGLFATLVALATQLFFIVRIWKFSDKKLLFPLVFVPCSIFQLAGYVAFQSICYGRGPTAEIIVQNQKLLLAIWSVQAAEDVIISLSLLGLLWKNKVYGAARSTNRILYRLTVLVINTGAWTALCSIATNIALVVNPDFQLFPSLNFVLSPLYCNTVLANLNARDYIRGNDPSQLGDIRTISFASSSRIARQELSAELSTVSHPQNVNLEMHVPTSSKSTTSMEKPEPGL